MVPDAPCELMSPLPGLTRYSALLGPTACAVGHIIAPLPWLRPCQARLPWRSWGKTPRYQRQEYL